jgi:DNA modification methylase
MYKRNDSYDLTFANEKVIQERHKVHPYPAMLHPFLVEYLLENYSEKNSTVLDPFCGTGVTLLQSSKRGIASFGFDINPLALLIAKVKTAKYNNAKLNKEFLSLQELIKKNKNTDIPDIYNIDFWYKENAKYELGLIRYVLKNNNFEYKDFFLVCFGFIARNQSNTRNGEFKKYRMKDEKVQLFLPTVIEKFFEHIKMMIDIFEEHNNLISKPKLFLTNSEDIFPNSINFDLVVTSPPYGDSKTTVAYGQYSSFASDWIGELNPFGVVEYRVDNESLGKNGEVDTELLTSKELNKIYTEIQNIDSKRANDVLLFFNSLFKSLKNTVNNLNEGGTLCYVVGNRTVKGVQIPMDQITASLLQQLGMNFKEILVRDIVNKVMPVKNSPTNVTGVKKTTMVNEYIVIFTK